MRNFENDKYIIKENYYGDVKLTKNNTSKKVDLSKPTDILDHRVKPQIMPTIYTNSNLPINVQRQSNKRVYLTKPKDIITKEKKSVQAEMLLQKVIVEEHIKRQQKKITISSSSLIILVIISLIPVIVYVMNNGLEVYDAISLIVPIIILISKFIEYKK